MPDPKDHKLSVFILTMLNVAMVMSLRGLPIIAKEGLSMIFYILFASLLFLVPVAFVSAELATGWPQGGVYRWVKEAFGSTLGFTAIWLQWIQNTLWYSTVLAFAAGALSYLFLDPSLSENRLFIVITILVIYWGANFINFCGLKTASWASTIFVFIGTIFPGVLIIFLGLLWVIFGNPLEFLEVPHHFFPDFHHIDNIAFLAGTVLLFSGMEVSAVHANELKDPSADYPKATLLSALAIFLVFALGSLAIAAIIPAHQITLTAGIMQGLKLLLDKFHMGWMLPVMGFLVAFGTIGSIIAWIGGPSKGLLETAKDGELPPFLQKLNKNGIQTHILWVQGAIVTLFSCTFLVIPDVNTAFFLLTSLTATLYLIMYFLLYAAAIRLRYSKPDQPRAYKIPGGKWGIWLIAGVGILAVVFAIIVSYFPPSQLTIASPRGYVLFMIGGSVILTLLPIVINYFKRPSWTPKK